MSTKTQITRIAFAAVLFGLSGCATGNEKPTYVAALAADPVAIEWVHARATKQGIAVSGSVVQPPQHFHPVQGRIEVSAMLGDGTPVVTKQVRWGAIPRRGIRRAAFSVHLPVRAPEAVQSISVRYVS